MIPLFHLESCSSTQDEILTFLEKNPEGAAVFTFNQTGGRGQYGNSWESPENLNLAYSFALKTSAVPVSGILFNFRTAVIVRNFLAKMTNTEAKIKWPNDIILNGKKICGMITEQRKFNENAYFIAGIGINILQQNFQNLPKAGSLLTQTNGTFDLLQTAKKLHQEFELMSNKLLDEQSIMAEFNQNLFKKDEIAVFETGGIRQNGIIRNADAEGFLTIELENDGVQKFFFKEIEMLY